MRISDWSSDVCSSDLLALAHEQALLDLLARQHGIARQLDLRHAELVALGDARDDEHVALVGADLDLGAVEAEVDVAAFQVRSEERRVGKEGVSKCKSLWSHYN